MRFVSMLFKVTRCSSARPGLLTCAIGWGEPRCQWSGAVLTPVTANIPLCFCCGHLCVWVELGALCNLVLLFESCLDLKALLLLHAAHIYIIVRIHVMLKWYKIGKSIKVLGQLCNSCCADVHDDSCPTSCSTAYEGKVIAASLGTR